MKKGSEIEMGYVPAGIYTVLVHTTEEKISSSNNPMVVASVEIISPETAQHAGASYKTLGQKGKIFFSLCNKNGEESALNILVKPLKALGVYDQLPDDYGADDVKPLLLDLQGKKFPMFVESEVEYIPESGDPKDSRDPAKAKRDPETREPMIRRHNARFDAGAIRGKAVDGNAAF